MKLRGQRGDLLTPSQLASTVVSGRDLKPVLRSLKAIVDDDRCILLATDLELGIRLEVRGVTIEEPGEALLPASRLVAILREAPDEELSVEADAQTTSVRGQANEFEMPSDDPATFPDIPAVNGDDYHEISAGALKQMIQRTIFAAASESPRYAMNGTLWEAEGNTIRLVATDGRRMAVVEGTGSAHEGHGTKTATHVVPTKAMQLLQRNLNAPDQPVRVTLRPNEALFHTGPATIYTRLVEGRYPTYKEVFPKKASVKLSLTAGPLHAAIRQAAIMVDADTRRVLFQFSKNKLVLKGQGAEAGRSQVELAIPFDGKPVDIAFDPRLVTDMLRALDPTDELMLEMTDSHCPALFRYGDDYSYLVMPLY